LKLVRYGNAGSEKPGVLDGEGNIRDLSNLIGDFDGRSIIPESLATLRTIDVRQQP
jgi:hypothetical protein